jgi:hypothetical protein
VCGRSLLPFCLRHRIALEVIDSPFIYEGKPFGPVDVINAVRVLSTHDMRGVNDKLSFKEGYHLARMRININNLKREGAKIFLYFASQSLWPRFWEKDSSIKDNGIPWQLSVIACLVRNGHTTQEAWTMPEAEAIWLNMAHAASVTSDVKIVSDKEWEAMEQYKASQQTETNTRN